MSVKYSPQDKVVVTQFRYNPSSTINIFDLAYIKDNLSSVTDGGVLTWDSAQNAFVTKPITFGNSSYDANGNVGGVNLIPRISYTDTAPTTLVAGELAYSLFPERTQNGVLNGGMTLYVGDANGVPVAISSQSTYNYLNHQAGITVANAALIVGDNKEVDQLTIGDVYLHGSTLTVTNPFADLKLAPGGNASVSATGHKIINVADPIAPQDAATKKYVDNALANFSVAPVTIGNVAPVNPDNGDLWYDADETYRLYVWNTPTASWVDASPSIQADPVGLVIVANNAPGSPKVGQAWFDADDTGRTYVWDGIQWVDMNPQAAVPPANQVTVADAAPIAPKQGDLWYDSLTTYRLYVWDNIGQAWIDASPNAADNGAHVTIADTAPIAPKQGDQWYDSRDTFRTFVWDNAAAAWLDMSPSTGGSSNSFIIISNTPPVNPEVGQAWYDADGTGRTYVWDSLQWVDIAPQAEVNPATKLAFTVDAVAPTTPLLGDAWWNTQNLEGYVWDGAGWVQINPSDRPHVIIASAPPANPIKGDMWYDEDPMSPGAGRTYVWDSVQWIDLAPQIQPPTPQPLVIISNNPPANPIVGQAWYDADQTGRTYVWDSVQWVDMNPQAIPPRSSIVTVADTSPTNPLKGDLWYDSSNTYRLYVYDAVTDFWVDASPNSTPVSATVTVADVAPTTPIQGDLWYDSLNTYRLFVWDSNSWIDASPDAGSGGGLVIVANAPPATPQLGQAWYDSDVTGRTYVWDGLQWIDASPNAFAPTPHVTVSDSAPLNPKQGDLWYDSLTNFRTYVWDEFAHTWMDIAPSLAVDFYKPKYEMLETKLLPLRPAGFVYNVSSGYKGFVVEVINCALTSTAPTAGWVVNVTTDANRAIQVGSANVDTTAPTFTYSFSFNNYVDGGISQPSTFFMNKYNEYVLSIEIKPNNLTDTFTSGTVNVWGIK